MLGLRSSTDIAWVAAVNSDPERVLCDHAHCEKKAAAMAISLLNRYPERRELVEAMAELAQEEMSHFAMVLQKIYAREFTLSKDPGDQYAQALHAFIRKQEPERLLDTLIVSSLIEARSCERFQLLSETAMDEDLKRFYFSLLESEAHHRTQFLRLARLYFSKAVVDKRLDELSTEEAKVMEQLENIATMHG